MSGFYTVEDVEYVTRMYRVTGTQRIVLEPVPIHYQSLDSKHVYLLDVGMNIFLWNGFKCNPITRSKARLFAEKINKHERKFQAELIQMKQGDEVMPFWKLLHGPPDEEFMENPNFSITNTGHEEQHEPAEKENVFKPKLYKVGIGMGYLELPQVKASTGRLVLHRNLLDSRGVYILDCYTDIFVWIGRKSTRLVRTAALKLSSSLEAMINRPNYTLVTSTLEGTESQVFKSKFEGWDDLIAVDYTRTAEAVSAKNANYKLKMQEMNSSSREGREGSVDSMSSTSTGISNVSHNLLAPNSHHIRAQSERPVSALPPVLQTSKEPLKTDLVALFVDRYVPVPDEEALGMMEEINDFLESMKCFVFENKRFVRLPDEELGQFYSEESYLFICKYWKVDESDEQQSGEQSGSKANGNEDNSEENGDEEGEGSIECKLYFWQGRDANNAGWLTFTFSLKKKFKDIEIIKQNQQQENPQFLAHFKRKFIVHKGKRSRARAAIEKPPRPDEQAEKSSVSNSNETKMYHVRKNPYSAICTRCIQLDAAKAQSLCSEFCFIVCVPFENSDKMNSTKGIVYVWIGSKSNPDEGRLAEEIAQYMYDVSE